MLSSFKTHLPLTLNLLGGVALVLLMLLTGHSDAVDVIQDNAAFPAGEFVSSGIGQTFVSRYPRLHAIQVRWIVSDDLQASSTSRAVMHLYRAGDSQEIATATLRLSDIHHNDYAKFVFPPIQDSEGVSFHFKIDISPVEIQRGYVSLWTSGEDSYAGGQMYLDELATDRDLCFRTYYEPDAGMLLWTLTRMLTQYGPPLLIALLALLILGSAMLLLGSQWGGLEGWAMAGSAGLALLSAVSLVQLILPIPAGGLVLALAGAGIAWRVSRAVREHSLQGSSFSFRTGWPMGLAGVEALALVLLSLLALAVSLLQIRDVPVPLWVDSVTHAGIIQNLLVTGRLPVDNFYHLGYHATTALLTQLTGLSIPQAMLLLGQLLVLQVGLSVFLLTRRLSASFGAGLVAAVAVWFLSPTPSYFVTWGRYPLLMGSAILPLAIYAAIELVQAPRWSGRAICFAVTSLAGLAFAHIRLVAFYVVFMAVYLLYLYICRAGPFEHRRRYSLFQVVITAGAGIAFGFTWLAFVLLRGLNWQTILGQSARLSSPDIAGAVGVLLSHHGPALWLLASIGVLVGILRRTKMALISLAWYTGLLAIAALPADRTGGEYLSPGLVLLMLYLPAALLTAEAIHWFYCRGGRVTGAARAAGSIALIIAALIGARDMVSIVNPATVLFSSSDAQAMEWIKEKTPPQSKFLLNTFLWTSTDYAPADGGAWIPYLTGRSVLWRPLQAIQAVATNDMDFIYLGWRSGVRTRSEFACQPDRYRLVYHQAGIAIFQAIGVGPLLDVVPSPFPCDLQGFRLVPARNAWRGVLYSSLQIRDRSDILLFREPG